MAAGAGAETQTSAAAGVSVAAGAGAETQTSAAAGVSVAAGSSAETDALEHDPSALDFSGALQQFQVVVEDEKAALARALHDDLGGLLVGAIMDVGWIAQQCGHSALVKDKLARASNLLRSAIDLKRTLIENLRPTLLDNVGLFATLRWHMKATCDAAGVSYRDKYPEEEAVLEPEVRLGVFRIVQEALRHFLADGEVSGVSLEVDLIDNTLRCHLATEHVKPPGDAQTAGESPEASMHHRAKRFGGSIRLLKTPSGNHAHLNVPF